MEFKEFMKEYWIKSVILFMLIGVFTALTLYASNFLGEDSGVGSEIVSSLTFFISLIILLPFTVATLVTESPVVWLGITWNSFIIVSSVIINLLYVYVLSCGIIILIKYLRGD